MWEAALLPFARLATSLSEAHTEPAQLHALDAYVSIGLQASAADTHRPTQQRLSTKDGYLTLHTHMHISGTCLVTHGQQHCAKQLSFPAGVWHSPLRGNLPPCVYEHALSMETASVMPLTARRFVMAAYSLKVSATDAVRNTSKPSTTSVIDAAVLHAFSSLCASTCVCHIHTKRQGVR